MRYSRQAGFGLVEVLMAALVLGVGIMGAVASHLVALRTRQATALTSTAVVVAGSAAERIRANVRQRDLYIGLDYDALRDGAPSGGGGAGLAASDLHELREAVYAGFPSGRIVICRDGAVSHGGQLVWSCAGGAGAPVAIKVGWVERGPGAAPDSPPAVAVLADGGAP